MMKIITIFLLGGLLLGPDLSAKSLPPNLTAAILVKLLAFDRASEAQSQIRIHVIGEPKLAEHLQGMIGQSIGNSELSSVSSGSELPNTIPHVVFIGKTSDLQSVIEYAQSNQAMSICSDPMLAGVGISLTIFDDEGVPGILLNSAASRREGVSWRPEILEVANALNSRR